MSFSVYLCRRLSKLWSSWNNIGIVFESPRNCVWITSELRLSYLGLISDRSCSTTRTIPYASGHLFNIAKDIRNWPEHACKVCHQTIEKLEKNSTIYVVILTLFIVSFFLSFFFFFLFPWGGGGGRPQPLSNDAPGISPLYKQHRFFERLRANLKICQNLWGSNPPITSGRQCNKPYPKPSCRETNKLINESLASSHAKTI